MGVFNGAFDSSALMLAVDILVKLGIGAIIGAAIGYERELHGRPAGIRTHMLMVIGVVLFCEVSKEFAPGDPTRIAAQVLTGVGFLGAGTIMRLGAEIKGLTSAASIWAAASTGMAVSIGGAFIWVALCGTGLCLITLSLVDNWERKLVPNNHIRTLQAELASSEDVSAVVMAASDAGGEVRAIQFLSRSAPVLVSINVMGSEDAILSSVVKCSGVQSAHWTN